MENQTTRLLLSRMQPLHVDIPLVPRSNLLAKHKLSDVHLTIVHAPAGYGKTTLLIQYFQQLRQQTKLACWLTFDETFDEPTLLLTYLINALNSTNLIQQEVLEIANNAFTGIDHEEALNLVINCISEFKQPVTIFLDDYHLILLESTQKVIHKLLETTSEGTHFILATRNLPSTLKGRLQISRSYSEITSDDLALSLTETRKLLDLPDRVNISDELISGLFNKTEGWPAAIRFAKTWFNEGNEASFSNLNYCTKNFSTFISTQIFEHLPKGWKNAMIRTSAVREFDGKLIDVLCETTNGWEIIDGLYQQGLILSQNQTESSYRYHPLLRKFLQSHLKRMNSQERLELHKRAAGWCAKNGDFDNAIKAAMASGDADFIADVTEQAGGWHFILDGRITSFIEILEHLPTIIIAQYPNTYLGKIILIAKHGEVTKASQLFDEFQVKTQGFTVHNDQPLADSFKNEADVASFILDGLGDIPQTTQHIKKMETALKEVKKHDHFLKATIQNCLSFGYFDNEQYAKAFRAGEAAISHFREIESTYGENFLYFHLGKICLAQGRLRDAEHFYNEGYLLAVNNFGHDSDMAAIAAAHLAETAYEKHQLDEAQKFLDICFPHIEQSEAWFDVYLSAYFSAANISQRKGSSRGAMTILNKASRTGREKNYRRLRLLSAAQRVRLLVDQGQLEKARWIIHKLQFSNIVNADIEQVLIGNRVVNEFILVLAYFYIHNNESAKAVKIIDPLLAEARRNNSRRNLISMLILISLAYFEQGKHKQSMSRFDEAISHAIFEGFKQPFLERASLTKNIIKFSLENNQLLPLNRLKRAFLIDLIDILNRQSSGSLIKANGGLTPREKEIVNCVCDGCSNKEIARICGCSENTVKFHLKNLFSKLGVNNRRSLAQVARELNTLDDG